MESFAVSENGCVAAVVVNYCTPELTLQCIEALRKERSEDLSLKVLVVDGASPDGSGDLLEGKLAGDKLDGWLELIKLDFNGGFGWANNQAILRIAKEADPPEFIYLVNPDAEVKTGAICALRTALRATPNCAAAGSQLLNSDGTLASSAFRFPNTAREFISGARSAKLQSILRIKPLVQEAGSIEAEWVTGASVMFRSEALCQCGLFDDGFFLYYEEVELMWRLRKAGWRVLHVSGSRVLHVGAASTGLHEECGDKPLPPYWFRSRLRFFALCYGRSSGAAANIAWLLGFALYLFKALIRRRLASVEFRELKGIWESGLLPSREDGTRSITRWTDHPGHPPAWSRNANG
jgi:GT2 family glycosyltransferase